MLMPEANTPEPAAAAAEDDGAELSGTMQLAAKLRAEDGAATDSDQPRNRRRNRHLVVVLAVLAMAAALIAGGVLVKVAQHDTASNEAASDAPDNLVHNGILVGSPGAAKTLEVYEDFLCPYCRQAEELNRTQVDSLVKDGTLRVIYHPLGWLDRASTTNYSTRSANAAAVVANAQPEAFATFHQLLFDNQPAEGSAGLSDDQLIDFAVKAGAERSAVEPGIRNLSYRSWVASATEDFSTKGYRGTPTWLVNGVQIGDFTPPAVKKAVTGE